MKQDLTEYSDNELSMHVFNDEGLYRSRNRYGFLESLTEYFIFTDSQLDVLKDDLTEDEKENA